MGSYTLSKAPAGFMRRFLLEAVGLEDMPDDIEIVQVMDKEIRMKIPIAEGKVDATFDAAGRLVIYMNTHPNPIVKTVFSSIAFRVILEHAIKERFNVDVQVTDDIWVEKTVWSKVEASRIISLIDSMLSKVIHQIIDKLVNNPKLIDVILVDDELSK